jgi:hypothetical protein
MSLAIKGFVESSLIEWEGNIVAILFLPHCTRERKIAEGFFK